MIKRRQLSPAIKSNVVEVEYLFLDLNVCERCIGTDKVLENVLEKIKPAISLAGYKINYKKTEIENLKMAEDNRFLSSPTIRVNGSDICDEVEENSCGCCSEISSTEVDCRVFKYKGKKYEVPPEEMLAKRIMEQIFSKEEKESKSQEEYKVPENLKKFFEGKRKNED